MKYILFLILLLCLLYNVIQIDTFTDNAGYSSNYRNIFDTHKNNFF